MEIVYDDASLRDYISRAAEAHPDHPVLVDRFLEDAVEIDVVDALCDTGTEVSPRRDHGAHRGGRDPLRRLSVRPPAGHPRASPSPRGGAQDPPGASPSIGVRGLINVQYALKDGILYVLGANPRPAARCPFVSKATAVPLAKACARVMLGRVHRRAARHAWNSQPPGQR